MESKKGIITKYDYTSKYDDDGIEYRDYTIYVDGKKYTSQTPKDLYLTEGAALIFDVSGTEILAGFCPVQGIKWGKNAGKLSRQSSAEDRYVFVQGIVLEKRKETSSSTDFSKETLQRHQGVGYTVILEDETRFNASSQFGEPVKSGMQIAVVLEKNSAVLLLDKTRGKLYGRQRPYFILFAILLIAFTTGMYYLQKTKPDLLVNFDTTLIVINIFLSLALLMSIYTFIKGRSSLKFLRSNLKA